MTAIYNILKLILCAVQAIGAAVEWAIMTALNLILAGIGGLWTLAIASLPDMPTAPDWSGVDNRVFGIVSWMFPVGFLFSTIASLLVLWLGWQAVAALLRWGKWI